ncbi:MAG: hypothetical protein HPM95_05165 [Alphaproteobacteria bacterium]|nr:hypothetical protein [Alphaproteobacteria bacterium]
MLSSSCAAALLAGTGGQAAAQDAPRLWGAWGELGAQAGAETNAFLEGFMPLGQDADSIVFSTCASTMARTAGAPRRWVSASARLSVLT